jgi:hypothetical protein
MGWGPRQDSHPRFFKRNKIDTLNPRIHSGIHPVQGARVLTLPYQGKIALHHFSYIDCAHFIEKLNRYTTIEAQQAFERGEHASMAKAVRQALLEFIYRYIRDRGYRDGWRGFYLCGFMAMYRWTTSAKLQELHTTGGRDKIIEMYHVAAEEIIAGYRETRGTSEGRVLDTSFQRSDL